MLAGEWRRVRGAHGSRVSSLDEHVNGGRRPTTTLTTILSFLEAMGNVNSFF